MSGEERRAEVWVARASALGVSLGLALRLALPFLLPPTDEVRHRLQGLNDEPAHLRYVEYVANHHALPVQTHRFEEPGAFARADFEFHQPPLYYAIAGGIYSAAGPGAGPLACRLFSALCGIATLALLWKVLATSSLPRVVTRPALAFASLWLTPAYFSSVVSNDALSWLLAAAIVALLWARKGGGRSPGRAAALAALLGFGLLTKTTLLVFFPGLAAIAIWESVRARSATPLLECAAVLLAACLIAAPWYLRNRAVYGSLWGLELGGAAQPYAGHRSSWVAVLANTNKYFWFPMQHVPMNLASRFLRAIGAVLLVVYGLAALSYLWLRRASDPREVRLAIVLAAAAMAYAARNLLWFAPEARFLLPAFIPIVYGLAAGSWAMNRRSKWAPRAALELFALALLPFLYLGLA